MRILIIHQYYKRGDSAGGSRWNEMSKVWREQGHDITVLAHMYSAQTKKNMPEFKGKLFAKEYTPDGIQVRRVRTPENYDKNYFWRALNYIAFSFLGFLSCVFAWRKFDVIVASSPPLTVGPLGKWLSIFKRAPLVFEIRDLWPESAIDTGVLTNQRAIKVLYRMEKTSYKAATRINALTPAFKTALIEKKGIPAEKIWMIPNAADLEKVYPGPRENEVREKHGWGGKFVGLYIGAHGKANHLWQLIDAAKLLRDDPDFHIVCVGNGMEREKLIAAAEQEGLTNIQFLPSVPKSEVRLYLNACDVSLIVLKKVDTFKTVYPNKMFDSMSANKPIILAIDGVARELVCDQAKCGTFVEPENAQKIIDAMKMYKSSPEVLAQQAESGLAFVRENFDRRKLARDYINLIEKEVVIRH